MHCVKWDLNQDWTSYNKRPKNASASGGKSRTDSTLVILIQRLLSKQGQHYRTLRILKYHLNIDKMKDDETFILIQKSCSPMLISGTTRWAGGFVMKIYHYLPKFFFSNSRNKHSKLATPIFAEQGCCFSSFQLAQKVFVWTHWVMSALLYMCRLICACVTAIYLMWLIWGFFGISKVATIRLKRPYISAQYIFECNIFPPAFQLKNENNMSGSGSLYFVAPLQFSYTAKGLQCLR